MDNYKNIPCEELLDDSLKAILADRYQDESHLFTPEAQQIRRNNRVIFTIKITLFMVVLIWFATWVHSIGAMSSVLCCLWIITCSMITGYNLGVCISHLKGWRD